MNASATGERTRRSSRVEPRLTMRDVLAVLEAEAHDDMGHLRPGPVSEKEIERHQLRAFIGALAPLLGEVGVGP